MFLFFSTKLGVVGSVLVPVAVTAVLIGLIALL
jgi:hypothetical protein